MAAGERPSIVLIGPSGAGKSTMAPLLAHRLGLRSVDLDDLRAQYYPEFGYDEAVADPADRAAVPLALAGAGAVVLLQPLADEDGSVAVLGVRIREAAGFGDLNRDLVTCTVLTGTRDPDRAADLVVERLGTPW